MSTTFLHKLLKRYSKGKVNKAERFIVDRWYASFQDLGDQTPGIETPDKAAVKEDKMFQKIIAVRKTVKLWYQRPEFTVAASLLLIASVTFIFYPRSSTQEFILVYHTEKGETRKVTLPDSTLVWMNAGTELKVLSGYDRKFRKVSLQGEAYFQVKHDLNTPFIISTEKLNTQVLGTSFNVSAYRSLSEIEVVVRTGKVSVSKGTELLGTLTPGKAVLYNKRTDLSSLNTQDVEEKIAWRNGKIMLNNANFHDLAEKFDNTFNVRLVTKNAKVRGLTFRLMLDKTQSLEENLNIITDIHQLKYRRINVHEIELYTE